VRHLPLNAQGLFVVALSSVESDQARSFFIRQPWFSWRDAAFRQDLQVQP